MQLFHYHHWTDLVEETEKFYVENGFQVAGRFAKVKDGIQTYHPPLEWEDFREGNPLFRIIEVRKGKVNITFGAGKKPMFDHIGFLVTKKEHDDICQRASVLDWNVNEGDRRTFIGTPYRFRIELQQLDDVIEGGQEHITSMEISVKDFDKVEDFSKLLGENISQIQFVQGEQVGLNKVEIEGEESGLVTDPNGVRINFINNL
ncbi:VOC family protein [Filobacillus milosensis]|uniref:VOC family protein n=1 Tax=Filobacillus milosensis TaxID=94137 RepID=A0A4Y8IIQ5_9BACI|nr:VOC family protein [Filobacillus milosensis]TFB19562.1 VOC family protein [Filobacillus milosensis]